MKYYTKTVAELVRTLGIGPAITRSIRADQIKDEKLADLWMDAKFVLNKIETYLQNAEDEQ
jgi:hypothetical protein